MKYRKLDQKGDYTFGNGNRDFLIDDIQSIIQSVTTRLKLWVGEWFIDQTTGVPYIQAILGKHDPLTRETAIRKAILDTEGVLSIVSFNSSFDPASRKLSISFSINTIYGESNLNEVNYVI